MTRKALGRGISALIPTRSAVEAGAPPLPLFEIDVGLIVPNKRQPRKVFHDDKLRELTESVRRNGILQPVLVRPLDDGKFELIAGERRWRAAREAGLERIPASVRNASTSETLLMALIENLHRTDLNPIETALGLKEAIEDFHLTHEEVAERMGMSRASVTNLLRLLHLPEEIRAEVVAGHLSMGHARALLSLERKEDQLYACRMIRQHDLSVRDTEKLAKRLARSGTPAAAPSKDAKKDLHINHLEDSIRRALGTKVAVKHQGSKGVIELHYFSPGELDRLVNRLLGKESP